MGITPGINVTHHWFLNDEHQFWNSHFSSWLHTFTKRTLSGPRSGHNLVCWLGMSDFCFCLFGRYHKWIIIFTYSKKCFITSQIWETNFFLSWSTQKMSEQILFWYFCTTSNILWYPSFSNNCGYCTVWNVYEFHDKTKNNLCKLLHQVFTATV